MLPATNWKLLGIASNPKGYKYFDKQLDDGPCKVVIIKKGRLVKAVCLGRGPTDLNYDLSEGQAEPPVSVQVSTGTVDYCAEFGGTVKRDGSDGKVFIAKSAPAPAVCP